MHVWDFLPEFAEALRRQLESDEFRWGDTWKHRALQFQTERIFGRYATYYDQWRYGSTPVPWLRIAGLALIAWIRETHPEALAPDSQEDISVHSREH